MYYLMKAHPHTLEIGDGEVLYTQE